MRLRCRAFCFNYASLQKNSNKNLVIRANYTNFAVRIVGIVPCYQLYSHINANKKQIKSIKK